MTRDLPRYDARAKCVRHFVRTDIISNLGLQLNTVYCSFTCLFRVLALFQLHDVMELLFLI